MPRYRDGFPRPVKEYHHGVWRVTWRWEGKKYSVSTAIADKAAISEIEAYVRNLASQLACKERPVVSAPWSEMPGVMRYIANRFGAERSTQSRTAPSSDKWIADYAAELRAECSATWAEISLSRLHDLGGKFELATLTPESASAYLSEVASKNKAGTRNRALAIFSRFYKWAIRTERATVNPFSGIKTLKEERSLNIVYCTPGERDEIIVFARETDWPDWLAVPVAFYTGMRRGEVARLQWADVRFAEGLIVVNKTKTGKSRVLPLSAKLEELLQAVPNSARRGHVVKIPDGFDRELRLENLTRKIEKLKRSRLLAEWGLEKPLPSRSKEYRDTLAKWKAAMKGRTRDLDAALERIGWNSFRHTFGSLLAQAGVSIDKISAWMGNTPEVCRRHYAQFIPRDRRDSEIDKL